MSFQYVSWQPQMRKVFSAGELTFLTGWLQDVQQVFPEIKWWKKRLVFIGKYLLF